MTNMTTLAQERLSRLVAALSNLRERVREAVAGEMGRAVGEAVRDLLTDALYRHGSPTPNPMPIPVRPPRPRSSRDFADEPDDPWADEDQYDRPPFHDEFATASTPTQPPPSVQPRRRWVTALTAGAALAARLVAARLPTLPALAAGIATCAAVLGGGPIVQTSLAALGVARDLLAAI